jgi:hypothetical protein
VVKALEMQTACYESVRILGRSDDSDTVVITESGMELITYYPPDLESLTIPV